MKWLSRHWVLSHKSQLAPCQTGLARREPGGESAWQQQELGGFCRGSARRDRLTAVSPTPEHHCVLGSGWYVAFGEEKRRGEGNEMGVCWLVFSSQFEVGVLQKTHASVPPSVGCAWTRDGARICSYGLGDPTSPSPFCPSAACCQQL